MRTGATDSIMATDTLTAPATRTRRRRRTTGPAADQWRFPLLVFAVHWVIAQVAATVAYQYGTVRPPFPPESVGTSWAYAIPLEPMTGLAHLLVEPFRLWDGSWYRLVATTGYDSLGFTAFPAKAAFWPLYPWLMDWGNAATGVSPETIGYILSNICFAGALVVLYRLVSLDLSEAIARRTLWALALFPTAFFFTAVYTESLFLLLTVGCLLAARRGEWWLAGVIGLLAALTRSAGVMLLAPMGILLLQQHGSDMRAFVRNAIPAALPLFGPIVFGYHLTRNGLEFLDWINVQWEWNRFRATPWETMECATVGCVANVPNVGLQRANGVDWSWVDRLTSSPTWGTITDASFRDRFARGDWLELVVTVGAFVLVLLGIRRIPPYWFALVLPPLIVPLFSPSSVHPLMSMPRFVLPMFPLFVVIALFVTSRRAGITLATLSAIGMTVLTMQFANWYWVS